MYSPALDGIRALAVLGVLAEHSGLRRLEGFGIGVYVFFCLSGFLITRLLLQERTVFGRIDVPRFFGRRAIRLLPALGLTLFLSAVYMLTIGTAEPARTGTLSAVVPVALYYANWEWFAHGTNEAVLGWLGHCWSLSVEEQFYLTWPIFLMATRSWPWRRLTGLIASIALVIFAYRLISYHGDGDAHRIVGTHLVADQLLLGALLAVVLTTHPQAVAKWCGRLVFPALVVLPILALSAGSGTALGHRTAFFRFGLTLVALASAVVIGAVVTNPVGIVGRTLSWRPLVALGKISYGVYLLHILVFNSLRDHGVTSAKAVLLLGSAGAISLATLSYFVFERPIRQGLHDRLLPRT